MHKLKHIIAESVTQLGVLLESLGKKISKLGANLHIKLKTEVGLYVLDMIKKTQDALKQQAAVQAEKEKNHQQDMMKEYDRQERNKLARMIKGASDDTTNAKS